MDTTLKVDNYIIYTPIITIINKLKLEYPSHKLRDVHVKSSEIVLTCVNSAHTGGAELHPDAHINLDPEKAFVGAYHCFSCGTATDFVGFIALYLDSTRTVAKEWLITNFGVPVESYIQLDSDIVISNKQSGNKLDISELTTYQSYCPYLQKRGISRNTAEKFNIKYDSKHRQVIFPVYNIKNIPVMLAKRSIDTKTFFMTANVEKEVYCLNYIKSNNIRKAIITEGPFDTLSGWEHNVPTIGTLGAISDYQIEQINNSGIKFLYTGFDNDQAGRNFAKLIKSKVNSNIIVTEIELPISKKDLNELTDDDWAIIKEQHSF